MNRRLFWKIFLPFWVAQALLLGVLYLRLHYRLHAENPWWVQPERRLVPTLARPGRPALRRGRPARVARLARPGVDASPRPLLAA